MEFVQSTHKWVFLIPRDLRKKYYVYGHTIIKMLTTQCIFFTRISV